MSNPAAQRLPRRIVIAGDGLAAWMAAETLVRVVSPGDYALCVIADRRDDDGLLAPDLADATVPSPAGEHVSLQIDEAGLTADTGSSFTHGIAVSGWSAPGATWFHPFGSVGAALGPVPFHHLVLRLRCEGIPLRLANYSLSAMAAQAGRFARPATDSRSVLSTCRYGMHLDCGALAERLRTRAEAAGVTRIPGTLRQVERDEQGMIAAVTTDSGQRTEGDLFIDCTGAAARLIGHANEGDWDDWSAWLPCNRVLSARVETARMPPPPYSHAQANDAGWTRHLPLRSEMLLTTFYASDFSSDDVALASLREAAGSNELAAPQRAAVSFGRRRQPWRHNCISLGAAAALIDPLAISNLQLLRSAIDRLVKLLPGDRSAMAEAGEYNRQTGLQLDHARDFAMLHYKLNGRRGEPLWDACRQMSIPSSLEYKLQLYESRGRVAMYDEEPLEEASWINLYDGAGVYPRRYSPIADGFSVDDLKAHAERVRAIMIEELGRMPPHGEYLSRLAAASQSSMPPDAAATRREARRRVGRFMGDSA